jgi:hypothetical protein
MQIESIQIMYADEELSVQEVKDQSTIAKHFSIKDLPKPS